MRPTRVLPVIAIVVAGLIGPFAGYAFAGGGGGGGGGSVCDGFAQGDEVSMFDSCFAGTAQLVDTDAAVLTVRNQGELPHTFTATDGSFDLYLNPGETGTVDIPDAVASTVYCTLHGTSSGQGMAGVIVRAGSDVVGASATRTPAPQPESVALDAERARAPGEDPAGDSGSTMALVVASAAAALSLATATHLVIARRRASATR